MKTSSLHTLMARIFACGVSWALCTSAFAQTSYNFNWRLTGDDSVAPLQVFDDGQRVYLQFAQGKEVPAVFADTPGGPILLTPEKQQPYTVITGLETKLSFRLQNARASAWRAMPDATSGAPLPGNPAPEAVATGLAVPVDMGGLAAPVAMNGSAQAPVSPEGIAARHGSPATSAARTIAVRSGPSTVASPVKAPFGLLEQRQLVEWTPAPAITSATSAPAAALQSEATLTPPTAVLTERHRIALESAGSAPVATATPKDPPSLVASADHHTTLQLDTRASASSIKTIDVTAPSSPGAPAPSSAATSEQVDETPADPALKQWKADAGMRLSELIMQWADEEGWTVRWDTRLDYPIEAPFAIEADSFLKAANNVFAAYLGAEEPFSVTAYANNVLIVKGLNK